MAKAKSKNTSPKPNKGTVMPTPEDTLIETPPVETALEPADVVEVETEQVAAVVVEEEEEVISDETPIEIPTSNTTDAQDELITEVPTIQPVVEIKSEEPVWSSMFATEIDFNAVTDAERTFCTIIDEYLVVARNKETTATTAVTKLNLLVKLLAYPVLNKIQNPSVLFDLILKFVTAERKTCLAERYVATQAGTLGEKQYTLFMTMYTVYIALSDCIKDGKKFHLSSAGISATLGPAYDQFVYWVDTKAQKLNK